jgi:hypothetical protein
MRSLRVIPGTGLIVEDRTCSGFSCIAKHLCIQGSNSHHCCINGKNLHVVSPAARNRYSEGRADGRSSSFRFRQSVSDLTYLVRSVPQNAANRGSHR